MNDYPNQEFHSVSQKNTEQASAVSTGNVSAAGKTPIANTASAANTASSLNSPDAADHISSVNNNPRIDSTAYTNGHAAAIINTAHANSTANANSTAHPGSSGAPAAANFTQTPPTWEFTPAAPITPQSKEEKEKRIRHFHLFSITSVIYALFYTFCLYKNASGITYPFFTGGTLFCFFLSLKKLGISAKKDSVFYVTAILLLGISTFCTDNRYIISMNKAGIFVLFFVLMIHNFYADSQWNFSKYMKSIFQTIFGSIGAIGRPMSDFSLTKKAKKQEEESKKAYGQYILIGILISIPLLLVIMMLLCSADMVFASIVSDIFSSMKIPQNFFSICRTLLFCILLHHCLFGEKDDNGRNGG